MSNHPDPGRDERYYKACLEHYTVSRRGLFRGLIAGARKASKHNEVPLVIRTVPRPPGAVDEVLFLEFCESCDLCKQACPNGVIEKEKEFPQLNLEYNDCSQCGACQRVCPTPALSSACRDIGVRPYFSGGCANRMSGACHACAEQCPQQAISISYGQIPQVDDSLCDGCGQCRTACYQGAIQLRFKAY